MQETVTKVKAENCVTGVHSGNDIQWMWDEEGIDLLWEEFEEEAQEAFKSKNWKWFSELADKKITSKKQAQEIIDNLGDYGNDTSEGRHLFGSWKKNEEGQYEPDKSGEYSAIYNGDYNTVQVVRSKFAIRCAICSPCYPNQGDVDTPPGKYGDVYAFCLPQDIMNEEWVEKNNNKDRIVQVEG